MAALQEYKCPCCGGAISFDSGTQNLKCPFCETEFSVDTIVEYNEISDESSAPDAMEWTDEAGNVWGGAEDANVASYICKSCGGEIIAEQTTAASACPYCGNPIVMSQKVGGDLKPDYVIPFKLNKEQAKEKYLSHLKGKRLLPKVFRTENHIDEIQGVYVPFWLFDADVDADVSFKGTMVRAWSDSRFNYTETSFYSVQRGGSLSFAHVPVDGSSRMDDTLMESLEPYDFSQAVDFKTAYLAGYLADRYDVDSDASKPRANERIRNSTRTAFRDTASGYATLTPENESFRLHQGSAKYAFYPVWILNTTWRGQRFMFAMNGQTGKFVGDLPKDGGLVARYFILTFLISFVICMLVAFIGFVF